MDHDYELTRRLFLTKILRAAGLAVFGVPDRMHLQMVLAAAQTRFLGHEAVVEREDRGDRLARRTRAAEHRTRCIAWRDPQMLVWWWRNIGGEMELNGQIHSRYLIWHPIDHIRFKVVKHLPDESVGPGAAFDIVEALGADMKNLIDARLHLQKLDEMGAAVEVHALGQTVLQIRGQFSNSSCPSSTVVTCGPVRYINGVRFRIAT